jgi:eukaryotic-like serine/threonine-protein kinase
VPLSSDDQKQSPVAPGDLIGGKYRVEQVLGAGGMGVVVAATHTQLDQRVALKFVLPHMLSGNVSVERFFREARSTVKLTNEHITRVHDVGTLESGAPYIVMELLDGADLAQLRRRVGKLTVPDAVEYVLQACEGLVEAHSAGIVHRDLKPQNLFVTRRMNGAPLVKILDFGISKATGAAAVGQMNLTDSATVLGSPLYMSPEQMRSARNVDARSDIWALGVILYELLVGKVPFDGETVTELCLKVVIEKETPVGDLREDLPPGLSEVVHRCLAKEPNDRYPSVAALADALEPYSRSAEKGGQLRPWRSFSDTADASSSGDFGQAREAVALAESNRTSLPDRAQVEKESTQNTWGNTQSGTRRRTYATYAGVAGASVLALAVVGIGLRLALGPSTPKVEPLAASSVSIPSASGPAPTPPPSTAPSSAGASPTTAVPSASAPVVQAPSAKKPGPQPSAPPKSSTEKPPAPPPTAPTTPPPPAPTASTKVNGAPIIH